MGERLVGLSPTNRALWRKYNHKCTLQRVASPCHRVVALSSPLTHAAEN